MSRSKGDHGAEHVGLLGDSVFSARVVFVFFLSTFLQSSVYILSLAWSRLLVACDYHDATGLSSTALGGEAGVTGTGMGGRRSGVSEE